MRRREPRYLPKPVRRTRRQRVARWLGFFVLAIVLALVIPALWIGLVCAPWGGGEGEIVVAPAQPASPLLPAAAPAGLAGLIRPEDQTYLTLPEWYIVYSADEYAAFIANNRPSGFPYLQSVGQYWTSYWGVCTITSRRYPFNTAYHSTLYVIGLSFTVENILKGLYESTVGRLVEWLSTPELSEEDALARAVAKEYGDFIHTIPWYEFPFDEKLDELWSLADSPGPNPIRRWERRLVLSLEYGGKAFYGRLIKRATAAAYAPEELHIAAVVEGLTDAVLAQYPEVEPIATLDDGRRVVTLPRYEAFTQLVPRLVEQGVRFVEIAGNDEIMLTALAPRAWEYELEQGQYLFAHDILTDPATKRIMVAVPIPALHTVLSELAAQGVRLEHIYDY
ncbi:MAG TPA: hypothetical protein VNK95_22555 [Caldilineaceae bacterium]|nr:hypothetical protein [Caldilineaceae bacterium]